MAGSNADSQRVATGAGGKVNHLFGLGVVALLGGHLVLHAGQHAQLALHRHVILVGVLHHLARNPDILLIGQGAAVIHHTAETHVDAALASLKAVAVVQVEHNLGMLAAQLLGILHSPFGHVAQQGGVGIFAGPLGHLQNHRALGLHCGHNDGLHLLHIVEIECGNGITAVHRLGKHRAGVHQSEFLVIYHSLRFLF